MSKSSIDPAGKTTRTKSAKANFGGAKSRQNDIESVEGKVSQNLMRQQHIPRHYDIHAWTLSDARRFLDVKYELGWRVVKMTPIAGGRKIIFLFEKNAAASQKPKLSD
jgi:hypothetical protein